MKNALTEDKTFDKIHFTEEPLAKGEYEHCRFNHCIFHNADLSGITFLECTFDSCDFSLANIKNTVLNTIRFINCKLVGVHFNECNPFLLSVYFENCILKHSVFYILKLKKTMFKKCQLQEADFTQSDLTQSVFDECDLHHTRFDRSNLEKVDFRTAFNYTINPETNTLKKTKFSKAGIAGLLDKYDLIIE